MTEHSSMSGDPAIRRTSPLLIVVAWAVVIVPLGWGVSQTVIKSMPLFNASPAPTTSAAGVHP